jgi:Phosphotransferase enzyme family
MKGHIGKQPLQDIIFEHSCCPPGPPGIFPSVAAFHDWFTTIDLPLDASIDPARKWLSDEVHIVFTHGDIHRRNIMVSSQGQGQCRIVALVDWHQSGWLPAYWEFCKALLTTPIGSDWETDYIPRFLSPHEEYKGFEYFVRRLGM